MVQRLPRRPVARGRRASEGLHDEIDGNSSGANMIQDAKNGKRKCHIFVLDRRGMLREKARNLEGYVSV